MWVLWPLGWQSQGSSRLSGVPGIGRDALHGGPACCSSRPDMKAACIGSLSSRPAYVWRADYSTWWDALSAAGLLVFPVPTRSHLRPRALHLAVLIAARQRRGLDNTWRGVPQNGAGNSTYPPPGSRSMTDAVLEGSVCPRPWQG